MAKSVKKTTTKERGIVIYLKNGFVAKVEEGNEIVLGNFEYAIVAEVKDEEINNLKLYKGDEHCSQFDVNDALMIAFNHDSSHGRVYFLGEMDKLRETFLQNVGRMCLKKDEKTEIKKFLYATYLQAAVASN